MLLQLNAHNSPFLPHHKKNSYTPSPSIIKENLPKSHMASLVSMDTAAFSSSSSSSRRSHLYGEEDQQSPCESLARRGGVAANSGGMEAIQDLLTGNLEEEEEEEEEEPGDLLEKSWFFGNLLDRKTRMMRCYSDPSPSCNLGEGISISSGKSYEETYSSLKKLPQGAMSMASPSGLKKAPSLPEESTHHHHHHHHSKGRNQIQRGGSKPSRLPPQGNINLSRAPSLPTFLGKEEILQEEEEESEFSMSKLIRQASLKTPDVLPPRRLPKAVPQSSSTPKNRPRRKTEQESSKTESPEGKKVVKSKLDRSSSDVVGELKGFKNLSLKWEKENQDLSVVPVDQGWKKLQRSSSSMEKRSAEDMKAQIKFWARAVASNVRQEC